MSERKQGPYAADDFAEIRKHLERVQGRAWVEITQKPFIPVAGGSAQGATPIKVMDRAYCAIRAKTRVEACWCYHAAPDGSSLPCPSREPEFSGYDDEAWVRDHIAWCEDIQKRERAKDGGDWDIWARNHPLCS
jgi:hypothetical protein